MADDRMQTPAQFGRFSGFKASGCGLTIQQESQSQSHADADAHSTQHRWRLRFLCGMQGIGHSARARAGNAWPESLVGERKRGREAAHIQSASVDARARSPSRHATSERVYWLNISVCRLPKQQLARSHNAILGAILQAAGRTDALVIATRKPVHPAATKRTNRMALRQQHNIDSSESDRHDKTGNRKMRGPASEENRQRPEEKKVSVSKKQRMNAKGRQEKRQPRAPPGNRGDTAPPLRASGRGIRKVSVQVLG
ncbi:hypothetical protein L1887_53661 [Cichorium endivia]|nr:hypothetical protein L1887_53661 [Cichorium endivia]